MKGYYDPDTRWAAEKYKILTKEGWLKHNNIRSEYNNYPNIWNNLPGCSKVLLHFDIFISKSPKLRIIKIQKQMGLSIHSLGLLQ